MADPTIQTFCCHLPNKTDSSYKILFEFNSDTYNFVCLISSFIGIVGAIYQILPREEILPTHRWVFFPATRGRHIIMWLAVADLMASAGVFMRSALWMNYKDLVPASDNTASTLFCALISAWTQYFYGATWGWTLCYAIDVLLVLKGQDSRIFLYHILAWVPSAVLTTTGLCILYIPDARCHGLGSATFARILPNYFATFLPMAVVMVANPILYRSATKQARNAICLGLAQYTRRERSVIDSIRLKFLAINVAFYICWLPNVINGFLLWTLWFDLPRKVVLVLWYIMASFNPLQALFNSIVYRRWGNRRGERIYLPCRSAQNAAVVPSSESPSGAALAAYLTSTPNSPIVAVSGKKGNAEEEEDKQLGADSETTPLLMRRRGTTDACGPVSINNGEDKHGK